MFVAALVVPDVFKGEGVLFGGAFFVVCAMHAALYALGGRGSPRPAAEPCCAWLLGRWAARP